MTDLPQAIAELKRTTDAAHPFVASHFSDCSILSGQEQETATILNAVASGELVVRADIELGLSDPAAVHYSMVKGTIAKPSIAQICHVYTGELIPLADAKLAVAEAYRKAADQCEVSRDKAGDDVSWHNCAQSLALKIEALTDTDALAEVQALRAERDAAIRARDEWRNDYKALSAAIVGDTGLSPMLVATQARLYRPRAEAAEAELAATQAKLARVVEAAEALGAMPEGYCFCSQNRIGDESKTHEPECRDFRLLLQKIKG